MVLVRAFLSGGFSFGSSDNSLSRWNLDRDLAELRARVEHSEKNVQESLTRLQTQPQSSIPTDDEARAIIRRVGAEITIDTLKADVASRIVNSARSEALRRTWNDIDINLKAAIASSRRHQITNLFFGGGLSLLAILVLSFLILDLGNNVGRAQDWLGLVRHYLPWLSMIVIIEIAVFFFLNMYRANIESEKHFSNELTTIMLRRIALEGALETGEKGTISASIKALGQEERNRFLRKGETTIDNERYRAESEGFEKGISAITKVVPWSREDAKRGKPTPARDT